MKIIFDDDSFVKGKYQFKKLAAPTFDIDELYVYK